MLLHTLEIPQLRYAAQARFDSNSGRSECTQDTRIEILCCIFYWIDPAIAHLFWGALPDLASQIRGNALILWIYGLAGSGKTTLAQTIARMCDDAKCLGASFFCARFGDRGNLQLIFPTIALHLGQRSPAFLDALKSAVRENPDIYHALPSRQLEKLIVEPLKGLKGSFPQLIVVIDALDECRDSDPVSAILVALSAHVSSLGPLKFIITSRPDDHIMRGFDQQALLACTHDYPLHLIPQDIIRRDIETYIRSQLSSLRRTHQLPETWPSEEESDALKKLMGDIFIVVSTMFKYIDDPVENNPRRQLEALIHPTEHTSLTQSTPLSPVNAIYVQVLERAFPKEPTPSMMAELKTILGSIILLHDQMSPAFLEILLHLEKGTVQRTLRRLHSVLVVPADDRDLIRIIHPSFPDFLVDPSRCVDTRFLVIEDLQHNLLANHCLRTINDFLKRNICELEDTSALNSSIADLEIRVTRNLPPQLQYACRYWPAHLCEARLDKDLLALLHTFCETHLLHWVEVLSLMGDLNHLVETIPKTIDVLSVRCLISMLDSRNEWLIIFIHVVSSSATYACHTTAI